MKIIQTLKHYKLSIIVLIVVIAFLGSKIHDITMIKQAKAELIAMQETPMFKADYRLNTHIENRLIMKKAELEKEEELKSLRLSIHINEASQRCEKQNKANNSEIDCKKEWKNYPKK